MFEELYSEYRPDAVTGGRRGATGRVDDLSIPKATIHHRGPEVSWNFFHPGRVDVRFAPPEFRRQLHAIDPRLEMTWHPMQERWVCWARNERVRFWMCPNWQRLFIVKYPDGGFMPLDARALAEAWTRSPKVQGQGKEFFGRVLDEMRRDYVKQQDARSDEVVQRAKDQWRFAQIKNIGQGNKFANHEAAD